MKTWQVGCVVMGSMIVLAGNVMAGEMHHAVPPGSPEFERIKSLAGRWEGTAKESDAEAKPTSVEYKVTSGGSVVVETLCPGTPHEMVSVYHDQNGKLAMTHYCMLGNRPLLQLTSSDSQHIALSLAEGSGIAPGEQHMHALTLTWQDPNHLTQAWTGYEGGKAKPPMIMTLSRVEPATNTN